MFIADAPPRELLEKQLGNVPAAVVAHIDDQAVALAFQNEVAMELRKACRHHVRQVQVSDAPARAFMYPAAVAPPPAAAPPPPPRPSTRPPPPPPRPPLPPPPL